MKVPTFFGKDPDEFLDWIDKVDNIFENHELSEEKKIKLATLEFTGYSRSWWNKFQSDQRRYHARPILTWEDMKKAMRKQFLPPSYFREMHNKLQRVHQGNRTVDEYYTELETLMTRMQIEESVDATMAPFLNGLRREIANVVELHEYEDMDVLLLRANKVERQLKERTPNRSSTLNPTTKWNQTWPKKNDTREVTKSVNSNASKLTNPSASGSTGIRTKAREITYFKCQGKGRYRSECPNNKVMIL
ncbi:retrotransposon gag family protein, partial [Candidatus Burkholderia verschuerenii]|uniref:retrotransposon gag family protein n=1 Tax=Candidatus Burkholderia verschuerenii TaxID=242163 RepID=UPI0018DB7CC3